MIRYNPDELEIYKRILAILKADTTQPELYMFLLQQLNNDIPVSLEHRALSIQVQKDRTNFELSTGSKMELEILHTRSYPWGWCYVSEETQKAFRLFCQRNSN